MSDQVLTRDGPVAVPLDYVVPATGELLPLTVRATVDGTSAVSAFYAVVQVIAPSGRVMGSYITSSIAAGASADVTWFPGHGVGVAGSTQTLIGARIQAASTQAVSDSTATDTIYESVFFDTNGMANLASDNRILTVHTAGIYLVIAQSLWAYNGAGRRINEVIQNDYATNSSIPSQFFSNDDRPANWSPVGGDGFGGPRTTCTSVGLFQAAVGDFFSSGVYQNSGGNLNVNGFNNCFLSAVLVGS